MTLRLWSAKPTENLSSQTWKNFMWWMTWETTLFDWAAPLIFYFLPLDFAEARQAKVSDFVYL